MSKRMSVAAACCDELPFGANVSGARALRGRLFVKVDALSFVELVEAALHRTPMEEPLLAAVVANEPEPSVPNESLDGAGRHPSLLGHERVPEGSRNQYSFHLNFSRERPNYGRGVDLDRLRDMKTITAVSISRSP
jgi:hypothetical protein